MNTTEVWPIVRLDQIATFRNGVNFTKDNFGIGVKVLGVSDFQDYLKPRYGELAQIDPSGVVTDRNILKDGDIVFVRSNGNPMLIGRSVLIQSPPEQITHSAFTIRLRFHSPGIDPQFYAYLFRTTLIRQALTSAGGGTNISNLNQDILGAMQVPVPQLSTQRRLSELLGAYDELIENNQRRVRILEAAARKLYREWFVHFRFPGHENQPLVPSALGKIPQGWDIRSVDQMTSFLSRGMSPSYDENGDSVIINQKCIRDQRLSLKPARRQNKKVPQEKLIRYGDVLVNSTGVGTLGRVTQVLSRLDRVTADSHVTIVRPKEDVDVSFFGCSLLHLETEFERLGVGATGQTELSRASIGASSIICSPQALQLRFGELIAPIRDAAICYGAQVENLRQTRDLLLPRLLSGQIELEAH